MRNRWALLATFSVAAILLLVTLLLQQRSVHAKERAGFETERAQLKGQITSLQQNIASLQQTIDQLKQTPEYYYQHGLDAQNVGYLDAARDSFETLISKFPTSPLVAAATKKLVEVNQASAQAKERQDMEQAMSGTSIDYNDLITEMKVSGLVPGKRYKVDVSVQDSFRSIGPPGGFSQYLVALDFDDPEQGKIVVRKDPKSCTVTLSMGDGMFHIHRAASCY